MPRLPLVSQDMVPEKFREAFKELTAETDGTISSGPGSITLNSPELARRRVPVTNYLRYETEFSRSILELATLVTARAMDCQYVWNAHAPAARAAGVSDALVDALRDKRPLPAMSTAEEAIVNYATEFFNTHKVSAATFKAALDQFGSQYLVELTAVMGHYVQTAFFLNAFEADLPAQRTESVLPI